MQKIDSKLDNMESPRFTNAKAKISGKKLTELGSQGYVYFSSLELGIGKLKAEGII